MQSGLMIYLTNSKATINLHYTHPWVVLQGVRAAHQLLRNAVQPAHLLLVAQPLHQAQQHLLRGFVLNGGKPAAQG